MRSQYYLSLLATTLSVVSCQQILPAAASATFPACALSCDVLLRAQKLCTPPNAIVSNQDTYLACFCSAPFLVDLYTTGETVCTSNCATTADRALLSKWFATTCNLYNPVATPTPTTMATSTRGSTTQSTAASTLISDTYNSQNNGPWIKTHWQWIIMLLFLFFGLLGLGLGARWFKKRHDIKNEQKRAAMSGFPTTAENKIDRDQALTPDLWGPHQHMAASNGYQYSANQKPLPAIDEGADNDGTSKEKPKRASRVEITEVTPAPAPISSKPPRL